MWQTSFPSSHKPAKWRLQFYLNIIGYMGFTRRMHTEIRDTGFILGYDG